MSPSGSQPFGFEQDPIGGSLPGMIVQVTGVVPGSAVPPQQSVVLVQTSPITRQPEATWQMLPPPATGTHSRLQQFSPPSHGSPSTEQPPEPVLLSAPQVPAAAPATLL